MEMVWNNAPFKFSILGVCAIKCQELGTRTSSYTVCKVIRLYTIVGGKFMKNQLKSSDLFNDEKNLSLNIIKDEQKNSLSVSKC